MKTVNVVHWLLTVGLALALVVTLTSIKSDAQDVKSPVPELIVLTKRDGEKIPATLNGDRLYKDPNMDAYVVFGRDMILVHNKATDEIYPISIGGMKSTFYKSKK